MLVMVVFFIAFRWIHLSTPLIRLFLLVLILLLMLTLNFLPGWFSLCLLLLLLSSLLALIFLFLFVFGFNHVVFFCAYIAFYSVPNFFACFVRFESSSVPTALPTAYDVYPLDGRHDGGYYTVKDCVTIDVLPRTPGNNVYVGFM